MSYGLCNTVFGNTFTRIRRLCRTAYLERLRAVYFESVALRKTVLAQIQRESPRIVAVVIVRHWPEKTLLALGTSCSRCQNRPEPSGLIHRIS